MPERHTDVLRVMALPERPFAMAVFRRDGRMLIWRLVLKDHGWEAEN